MIRLIYRLTVLEEINKFRMIMMRKANIGLWICLLWGVSSVCFLSACVDDEPVREEEGIVFRLSLPGRIDVDTRTPTLSNITIYDVWVVQYNASNENFLFAKNFSGMASAGGAIGEPENNGSIINVTTSEFSDIKSRFYIIVNAGTDFLTSFSGTETDLKQKTKDITPGVADEPTLLTTGPLEYTPAASGSDKGKVVIVAPLQRTFARVILKWGKTSDFKGTISVTGVKAYSLPTKMALYTRGGGVLSTKYPALSEVSSSTAAINIGSGELALGSSRTFYMGENLRGTGTATSFAEKNLVGKGPGDNGSLDGCTRLVLEAAYTYPGAIDSIAVEYCIYLGGNLMNDYNVQRGYEYNLNVQISGANSGDVRVTITNGNVVVFDEVDTINKNVDF